MLISWRGLIVKLKQNHPQITQITQIKKEPNRGGMTMG